MFLFVNRSVFNYQKLQINFISNYKFLFPFYRKKLYYIELNKFLQPRQSQRPDMSIQRRSFEPKLNPFLRTVNPFRVQQKFHTRPTSQQKSNKGYFTNHYYDSKCNHCVKNTPILEQMSTRSTFLKAQKQNLHKKPSTMFKTGKITSNPFEKSRLLGQNLNITNHTNNEYSRNDQSKLRSLLDNNPFKKYVQQRQPIKEGKELEVEFSQINLIKMMEKNNFEIERRGDAVKLDNLNNEKKSSARFSIDSINNLSNRLKSGENSPQKKSKFSPTIADIMSYRESSSKRSVNETPPNDTRMPCLMMQISKSRKDLIQCKKPDSQRQYQSRPISQTKLPPKSPQKQAKRQNQQDPQMITVKGKRFFLHPVKHQY